MKLKGFNNQIIRYLISPELFKKLYVVLFKF